MCWQAMMLVTRQQTYCGHAILSCLSTREMPSTQESWELMFDTVDTVHDCIRIATGVLSTLTIRPDMMMRGLSADMLATDLAEYLVRKGTFCTHSMCSVLF